MRNLYSFLRIGILFLFKFNDYREFSRLIFQLAINIDHWSCLFKLLILSAKTQRDHHMTKIRSYLLLIICLCGILPYLGAQAIDPPKMLPSTQADITPPDHFIPAREFQGYLHPGTSSSILLQEMEGTSFQLIRRGMTPDYFAQEGFRYIGEEEVETVSGMSGVLYRMEFTVQEVQFERLMLFVGDYHRTYWLVGNYPSMIKEQMFEPMKASLLTLKP